MKSSTRIALTLVVLSTLVLPRAGAVDNTPTAGVSPEQVQQLKHLDTSTKKRVERLNPTLRDRIKDPAKMAAEDALNSQFLLADPVSKTFCVFNKDWVVQEPETFKDEGLEDRLPIGRLIHRWEDLPDGAKQVPTVKFLKSTLVQSYFVVAEVDDKTSEYERQMTLRSSTRRAELRERGRGVIIIGWTASEDSGATPKAANSSRAK